jgi:hypothetical protein
MTGMTSSEEAPAGRAAAEMLRSAAAAALRRPNSSAGAGGRAHEHVAIKGAGCGCCAAPPDPRGRHPTTVSQSDRVSLPRAAERRVSQARRPGAASSARHRSTLASALTAARR